MAVGRSVVTDETARKKNVKRHWRWNGLRFFDFMCYIINSKAFTLMFRPICSSNTLLCCRTHREKESFSWSGMHNEYTQPNADVYVHGIFCCCCCFCCFCCCSCWWHWYCCCQCYCRWCVVVVDVVVASCILHNINYIFSIHLTLPPEILFRLFVTLSAFLPHYHSYSAIFSP